MNKSVYEIKRRLSDLQRTFPGGHAEVIWSGKIHDFVNIRHSEFCI